MLYVSIAQSFHVCYYIFPKINYIQKKGETRSLIGNLSMKHTYKVEKNAFSLLDNYFYSFDEANEKGELIQFEITKITNDGRKSNLINTWYKKGWINAPLKNYWSVQTYITDKKGNCLERYNPQILPGTTKLNFKWILEATEENKEKILEEIERRAFKGGK